MKTNFKVAYKKHLFLKKKTKIGNSVLGLRKLHFKTKNIPFEKSHNAENCKRGPVIHSVAKIQKIEGEPLESSKNFRRKNEKFQQSHRVEKSKKGPFGIFNIRSVAKYETN